MTEHEYSNQGWWCDGEAQQTLDKLAAAGIIDVQGALLDDASEDARDRNYFDQEQEGIGDGLYITVHSLPHLGRDMPIYLRKRIEPEVYVDGKFSPLELHYFGCLVGDGWAILVDRVEDRDPPDADFRDRVFATLGPGQCLWWDDKARTGRGSEEPYSAYDILLKPAGDADPVALVIAEPQNRVQAIYKWMLDPAVARDDMLWAGATLMICENWSGIAKQWTVLNKDGNPLKVI